MYENGLKSEKVMFWSVLMEIAFSEGKASAASFSERKEQEPCQGPREEETGAALSPQFTLAFETDASPGASACAVTDMLRFACSAWNPNF